MGKMEKRKFNKFKKSVDRKKRIGYDKKVIIIIIVFGEVKSLAGIKYSKQREAILAYLHSTKEHPTAETVYTSLKKENPKLSLGTVYRNLKLLEVNGEIQRLSCGDGTDHFDATTAPHSHFICEGCGRVMDLEMPQISCVEDAVMDGFVGEIHSHQVFFYGFCKKCM